MKYPFLFSYQYRTHNFLYFFKIRFRHWCV